MGDYYNATRGPLSVSLNDGTAASVTPKKWMYVSPENEGSASLLSMVSKGFLVRAKVDITQPKVDAEAKPQENKAGAPDAGAVVPSAPGPLAATPEGAAVGAALGDDARKGHVAGYTDSAVPSEPVESSSHASGTDGKPATEAQAAGPGGEPGTNSAEQLSGGGQTSATLDVPAGVTSVGVPAEQQHSNDVPRTHESGESSEEKTSQ